MPSVAAERKAIPLTTGVLDYFPDALAAVAECSRMGNEQHNPGEPLHWAKEKSTDHADCILRHMVDRGTVDTDGIRHSAKVAWRALAMLQIEIEKEKESENASIIYATCVVCGAIQRDGVWVHCSKPGCSCHQATGAQGNAVSPNRKRD
jgi:hypothetical protein